MGLEIERKFLVTGTDWKKSSPVYYCQGYLNSDKNRTVRIRIAGEQAFLTVKGITRGAVREEFEYSIPAADAEKMLKLCEQPLIEKNRRIVFDSGVRWEIDEFLGVNQGLIVAEVELESEEDQFELPDWAGREVTNEPRYFNSNLVKEPFTQWDDGFS